MVYISPQICHPHGMRQWHVELQLNKITILCYEEVLHRIGVYFSQCRIELIFFCYEVNPLMASQFEDSASLVDDSCKFKVSKCIVKKKKKKKRWKLVASVWVLFGPSLMSHSALSQLVGNRAVPIYNSIPRVSMGVVLHSTVLGLFFSTGVG